MRPFEGSRAFSVCAFHDESDPWVVYSDIDKTLSGLAVTHPDQVDGYKRYLKDALPVARLALDLAATQPSMDINDIALVTTYVVPDQDLSTVMSVRDETFGSHPKT